MRATDPEEAVTSTMDARWVQRVEAELAAAEAAWDELIAAGADPADPIGADMLIEAWVNAEADRCEVLNPGGQGDGFPVGDPGWIATHAHLLAGAPGSGFQFGAGTHADAVSDAGDVGEDGDVAGMAPGVDLVGVLDAAEFERLSTGQLADSVAAWEKVIAWAQAKQAAAVAALTHRPEMCAGELDGGSSALDPVAVTAGDVCTVWPWTKPQAQRLTSWGVVLAEFFPAVHQALAEGRLDARRARILTDALIDHDPQVARVVEAAVLPYVHGWTSTKVSYVVNRLLAEIAPETAKQRHRRERAKRRVWVEPAEDGMAWLYAYLPAEDAAAIMATLTAAADTLGRQPDVSDASANASDAPPDASDAPSDASVRRTLDQRRADALAGLGWSSLYSGFLGGDGCATCGTPAGVRLAAAHGRPVSVNVTVALSTLIGLDEHPGELDGYGPIDADVARRLTAAGVWRWVGTDPVGGYAIDYGRTRYTPPQDLVDFVILRDRECIMPGCHRSAWRCEIDHRVPYPQGPTSACNCSALCKPCHLQKHHAGWTLERLAPGVLRWTSPSGHQQTSTLPRIAPATPDATHPPPDVPVMDEPPF